MVRVGCDDSAISAVLEGGKGAARRVLSALAAAVAVGGMEACLDMSVEYAKIRHQFGRPIGSFQAVKHLCANMLVDTELAAACAWDAARPSTNTEEADLVASVAAGWTLPAFRRVAQRCVQAHGGVGYTWEHDAHLYLRRASSLGGLLGPSDMAARRAFSLFRDGIRRVRTVDLPAEVETRRGACTEVRRGDGECTSPAASASLRTLRLPRTPLAGAIWAVSRTGGATRDRRRDLRARTSQPRHR